MIARLYRDNRDLLLVGGLLAILTILFAPIPPAIVDLAIVANFGFALMCSDRFNAQLRRLAMSDPVTGSLNRSAIEELAQKELKRTRRTRSPLSLLMLDLDHFKSVNDTYGHLVGDQVLRGFVDVVRLQLRAYDLIARFGGEEFVVLLPDTETESAVRIAAVVAAVAATLAYATAA